MNVGEFITELQQYNPDAEVTREDSETIYLSFLGDSPETAKIVFIEQRDYVDERFE